MTSDRSCSDLEAVFRATTYRAKTEAGDFELRIGGEHAVFDAFLAAHDATCWAIVIACNPGAQIRSERENAAALRLLREHADALGLPWYPVSNHADDDKWPVEYGVLLLGASLDGACRLAREFGQLACVAGTTSRSARLVWIGEQCTNMKT